MLRYFVVRCLLAVGLVFLVVTLVFAFLRLVPGDPAELILTGGDAGGAVSPESIEALRASLGLDKPVLSQYVSFIGAVFTGDFGTSFQYGTSVSADIALRLPRTMELVVVSMVIALIVGVPLGVLGALKRGTVIDSAVTGGVSVGQAIPVFVFALVLVLIFSVNLGWLPAGGYVAFGSDPARHLGQLVLPAFALSLTLSPAIARMTRSSVLEVMRQDWVRTARAKGLTRSVVFRRHILRNALSPIITVVGLQLGHLLSGAVLVEYVFNWPGMGSLLFQAVSQRDYPEVQGVALVAAGLFVFLNVLVDLSFALLDPRVRYSRS